VDGHLHGVVLGAGRRPALSPLGPTATVQAELDAARFALRRLAFRRGSAMALDAARTALDESARRLDDLLFGRVRSSLGDRPLVVVPTAALHVVPWAVLPSLLGRPVTVAPSAGLWLRAVAGAMPASGRVALVAGPRLTGAGPEVAGLARRYPDAVRLTGRRATVDATRTALDGARLAHVAAHGRFRADNPMFSTIELADGPLTVHDLEDLRRPPAALVLSACDSGLSTVHAGDELLGLAASLLGLGTRTLVASLLPVPDDATRLLMLAFHRHLQAGASAAEALAVAQAAARDGDHGAVAAAASFVCLGAS
jgi:CHAT domain-containing protein